MRNVFRFPALAGALLGSQLVLGGQVEWSCSWPTSPLVSSLSSPYDPMGAAFVQLVGAGANGAPDPAIPSGQGTSGDDRVFASRWVGAGLVSDRGDQLFASGDAATIPGGEALFVRVWTAPSPSFRDGLSPVDRSVAYADSVVRVFSGGGDAPALPVGLIFPIVSSAMEGVSGEDQDGDGLPDWWETLHFQDAVAAEALGDADGDGLHNLAESVAGSDPRSATSLLRLNRQTPRPNGVEIQWQSEPGRTYTVSRASALGGRFELVATGIPATPPANTFISAWADESQTFLRVEVEGP